MRLVFLSGGSSEASRRAVRRRLALLASVVCLWGYLFGFAHMAVVQHVSCPEHGELVHAGGGRATPAQPVALGGSQIFGVGEEHPTDDHCLAAGLSSEKVRGTLIAALAPHPPTDGQPALGTGLPARGMPVLRWAPKTSPPAAP